MTTPSDPTRPDDEAGRPPASPYGQPPPYGQPSPPPGSYGQPATPPGPYGQPGPPPTPAGYGVAPPGAPQIAGMADRLVARIIDGVLLAVVGLLLAIPFAGAVVGSVDPATGEPSAAALASAFVFLCVYGILTLAYEVVLIAIRGQTIGKQVMRLTVRREADGAIPGWGPSVLRWLVPVGAGIVTFCLGGIGQLLVYVSPFFDNSGRNQGWHDKVAKTLVVKG
jgi:uncharacterized RDD family membrane protein YckC